MVSIKKYYIKGSTEGKRSKEQATKKNPRSMKEMLKLAVRM